MSTPATQTPLPRPPIGSSWWATYDDLPSDLVQKDSVKAAQAIEFASFVIFSLAGRMHSPVQLVTELYDTRTVLGRASEVYPVFLNGQPYNCCGGASSCCCNHCGVFHRTRLSRYPVQSVDCVWADGVQLPPSSYVLLDNAVLGLLRGVCEVGCLLVTYCHGTGIPPGGRLAVAKMAEELLSASVGGPCNLPSRVTQVTRQGVSWTLLDPQDFLKDGRTGVYEVDLLLSALNPAGALRRPKVFSPDIPQGQRVQQSIPSAPLPIVLFESEAAVASWHPDRMMTTDRNIIQAAQNRTRLRTELLDVHEVGHDLILVGSWQPSRDGRSAILNFTETEKQHLRGNAMSYQVISTSAAGVERVIGSGRLVLV